MDKSYKSIGARIRIARESTGLSQGEFAKAIGLSSEFISLIESGKRRPSFTTIEKVAAYFNKDIPHFFQEIESPFTVLLRGEDLNKSGLSCLKRFQRYCAEYLDLEKATGRRLEPAPLYTHISADHMADEERRRLGLGNEPIRDVFGLCELNGLRLLRMPLPEESKVSGVFVYLEEKNAGFALINSAVTLGRQVFSAAHEYCHYLKDRLESPVIDNPDVFIDEYVSLYHPREQFAQKFAARFLMPPSKIQEILARDFRGRRPIFDDVLFLKRYFGVSTAAMLRTLRDHGHITRAQFEEYYKIDSERREEELFGNLAEGKAAAGAAADNARRPNKLGKKLIPSDRFRLLRLEAIKK